MSIASGSTINGQARNQAFTYDNVGRLLTASGWSVWGRRFSYDRWGNRTGSWNAVSGGTQLQNIAMATTGGVANNRIANVNGVTYSYDASGNCTFDGPHGYTYDAEHRQVSVDGGATATSAYDTNNRRLKKVAGGVTTHYVWQGAQVIAEYNGSTGTLISEYIYAGSRMVARDQGGVLRYFHQDRLSTRLITNSSGAVVGTEDHLPFGEEAGFTGETEKHRFTSYERDTESGTDYAINRQHQYTNGRFMRPDPIAGSIGSPQSLNRYSYVGNDPINSTDSLGLAEDVWALYRGTFMGGGGGGGFGADYAFWGDRIADLPGFGSMWGSMSEFSEWQYGRRLQNTYDRIAAESAWRSGNYSHVATILNSNPNVGMQVGGAVFWGELGAVFATGYGEASLIASLQVMPLDPIRWGIETVFRFVQKLRGPDFVIVNFAYWGQYSVAIPRGGGWKDRVEGIGGSTGAEVSGFVGWMLQLSTPSKDRVSAFLSGWSYSADGFGNGAGLGILRSPNSSTKFALLFGGGLGGGLSVGWGTEGGFAALLESWAWRLGPYGPRR